MLYFIQSSSSVYINMLCYCSAMTMQLMMLHTSFAGMHCMITYSGINLHMITNSGINVHMITYSGINLHMITYRGINLHMITCSAINLHMITYSGINLQPGDFCWVEITCHMHSKGSVLSWSSYQMMIKLFNYPLELQIIPLCNKSHYPPGSHHASHFSKCPISRS